MLGGKLKALRLKHSLTQSDAANLVRVTQRTWARYEAGDRIPPAGTLELFCIKINEPYPEAIN